MRGKSKTKFFSSQVKKKALGKSRLLPRVESPDASRPHASIRAQKGARVAGTDWIRQAEAGLRADSTRWVMGLHASEQCIRVRPQEVHKVFVSDLSLKQFQVLLALAKGVGLEVCEVGVQALDKRFGAYHQGVVVLASALPEWQMNDLRLTEPGEKKLLLAFDGTQDPHNLGAMLRTAWLLGVRAAVLPQDRTVGLTPAVHKVACGGVEHVPLVAVVNLARALDDLKKQGFWVYGLSEKGAQSVYQTSFPDKVVLVVGAEDKGLRPSILSMCDNLVMIPQIEATASLNASVATAIVSAEVLRQWQV